MGEAAGDVPAKPAAGSAVHRLVADRVEALADVAGSRAAGDRRVPGLDRKTDARQPIVLAGIMEAEHERRAPATWSIARCGSSVKPIRTFGHAQFGPVGARADPFGDVHDMV